MPNNAETGSPPEPTADDTRTVSAGKELVITHGYTDSNKGDLAILWGTVSALRAVDANVRIKLHSTLRSGRIDFDFHHRMSSRLGLVVEEGILPSPHVDDGSGSVWREARAAARFCVDIARLRIDERTRGRTRFVPALESLRASDLVIAKGGQYLYNDQGGPRGVLFLWRTLQIIETALRLGKPTVLLGHSIGPLNGEWANRKTSEVLQKCDLVVVRERISQQLLARQGLSNVVLGPDMAFAVEPQAPQTNPLSVSRRWVGVTVVNLRSSTLSDDRKESYIRNLATALRTVQPRYGLHVAIIPQVLATAYGETDIALSRKLQERLKLEGIDSVVLEEDYTPPELSYLYGQCEFLVGTRLHSCILAACAGVPAIGIAYQGPKTRGVMDELGLGERVHSIGTLNASDLARDMAHLLDHRDEVSGLLQSKVADLRESTREVAKMALGWAG